MLRKPFECSSMARKSVEHVEAVDEGVVAVRQDIAPGVAIADLAIGRFDHAEVLRLPVGADDPAVARVLRVVLVVALARHEHLEAQRRVVRFWPPAPRWTPCCCEKIVR